MRGKLMAGAAGLAVLVLAGCGGDHDNNDFTVPGGAVRLQSSSDALRELGNISTTTDLVNVSSAATPSAAALPTARAFGPRQMAPSLGHPAGPRARVALLPRAVTSCAAGGTDNITASGSKTFSFNYFSSTGTVNFETHAYSGCATGNSDGSVTTLDNQLESGSTGDSTAGYVLSGTGNTPLRVRTSETSGNNSFLADQGLLGVLQLVNGTTTTDTRATLNTTLNVQETGFSDYHGSFVLGSGSTFYQVISGDGSIAIAGDYGYTSNVDGCGGGTVTVSTPATLVLGTTSAGGSLPVGGALKIISGSGNVTFTFNADGSATLSGSVGGTLDANSVGQALQNGSSC